MTVADPQQQRAFALEVVQSLRAAGYEAYWAGGCVRDALLGRTPKDYDVATNAQPAEIKHVFARRKTLSMGAAFGVITIVGRKPQGQIEVATFREDAEYSDGRRPDAVRFSTAERDAQRRDFTINGLFFDPIAETVIDYVDGQADLSRRLVRAIGEPRERFTEDKLRLLRAVRFAAAYELTLDPATEVAIREMASQVTVVSAERIAAELRLMLTHANRRTAVELLDQVWLLRVVLPELYPAHHAASPLVDPRFLHELQQPPFPVALAALLDAACDPAQSAIIGRRLKLSNHEIDRTQWLLQHRASLHDAADQPWPKIQRLLISPGVEDLLQFHAARLRAAESPPADVEFCREKLTLPAEELNPPPLITGDDLQSHKVPRGKLYAVLLEAARDAQLLGEIRTKQEALALVDRLRAEQPKQTPTSTKET